jgi:hypothetical protein
LLWALAGAGRLRVLASVGLPVLGLGACVAAQAGGNLLLIDAPPAQDTLALGASWLQTPRAPDQAATRAMLIPAVDWYAHEGWFASTENGVGVNLSAQPDRQWGFRLWPQWGRSARDASAAMPVIGPRLQAQAFANQMVGGVLMLQTATAVGSARSRDGLQSEWGITSGLPLEGGLIGFGLSANWGNRAFRQDMFGQHSAGWNDLNGTLNLDLRLDARWHVDGQWLRTKLLQPVGPVHWSHGALFSLWRDW